MTIEQSFPNFDTLTPENCRARALEAIEEHRETLMTLGTVPPTVEDFLVPYDRAYARFTRQLRPLLNLTAAVGGAKWEEAYRDVTGPLTSHLSWVRTNTTLYEQFATVDRIDLDPESAYLIDTQLTEFRLGGIDLSEEERRKLEQLDLELSELTTEYSQRVARMLSGTVTVRDTTYTLNNFTNQLALASLSDPEARAELLALSLNRGFGDCAETDTREILLRIANVRVKRAHLLGYPTHAHTVIEKETAPAVDTVTQLLRDVATRALDKLEIDAKHLRTVAHADGLSTLRASDWLYYESRLKQSELGLGDDELFPYLELWRVVENGVFYAAHELFGITMIRREDLKAWDLSCRVYEVRDEQNQLLGLFIADYFTRDGKNGGAWMTDFIASCEDTNYQSIIINCANFAPPKAGERKYLVWDEVITLFHEFGHALHGFLSQTRYSLTSGTSVPRDFVELPSQLNEMWAYHPRVIDSYMRDDRGHKAPAAIIDKIARLKFFGQAFATVEYCAAALLDQAWHGLTRSVEQTVEEFEMQALETAGVATELVPPRYRSTYFPHIFTIGYDAGYYSYMWSEALVGECEEWFEKHYPDSGGLDRQAGRRYAHEILSRGNSRDPHESFIALIGHEARPEAIFRRRGL
ncbi:MAG: M3 family metallopeptidase [Actinomycetaceae bacterium]|nr:M3 family metallopeptidase [Actinomycetaceae bacterium]